MCRRLRFRAKMKHFKPQGVPLRHLKVVDLSREELEALKLKDYDGLDQNQAAEKMATSQSTFQRILSSARKKVAESLVRGKALKIEK
jgi:predicted DNA-binding protein (UPF0251 family)